MYINISLKLFFGTRCKMCGAGTRGISGLPHRWVLNSTPALTGPLNLEWAL